MLNLSTCVLSPIMFIPFQRKETKNQESEEDLDQDQEEEGEGEGESDQEAETGNTDLDQGLGKGTGNTDLEGYLKVYCSYSRRRNTWEATEENTISPVVESTSLHTAHYCRQQYCK